MMSEDIDGVLSRSEVLHSADSVRRAVDKMAGDIAAELADKDPLLLCVMNGAVMPTGLLLERLAFPLRLDYVHATRYRGGTRGGELKWIARPRKPLAGENLLIVDDIFDEGITLEMIVEDCRARGARRVYSAVLVEKRRTRSTPYRPDFVALSVEDRYVFGCGMDFREYLRNLPGIHAVADQDLR
jgi:hypoxanthine phosphoribosyltransferase